MTPAEALATILDAVDYTAGACAPTEMIGAILTPNLIQIARETLNKPENCLACAEARRFRKENANTKVPMYLPGVCAKHDPLLK